MIALEALLLVVAAIAATRVRPPVGRTPPRVLSLLATLCLAGIGLAGAAIVIVPSERVAAIGIAIAGGAGVAFLWLVRGPEDDEDGGEPDAQLPPAGGDGATRFGRKRTDAPTRSPRR